MKPDSRDALGLVLDRGMAGEPGDGNWQFFNASPIPQLEDQWKKSLICEQGFRPDFLALEKLGYRVNPTFADKQEECSGAITLLGRNRVLNEHRIATAWKRLEEGQRLIIAGDKTAGIGSIRKWFGRYCEIAESFSKFHSVVFWADKIADSEIEPRQIEKSINGYQLAEGMFSSNGPDTGSKLLAEHFDKRLGGPIADLGAGWGYLSNELLKRTGKTTELALYEADYASLEAAKGNVQAPDGQVVSYHWCDVTSEFKKKPYQWVIMNPPFHSGRTVEPELGLRFIEVAASTLPRGGRMLMVANRNLPYEKTIEKHFRKFEKREERDGYKVIEALR